MKEIDIEAIQCKAEQPCCGEQHQAQEHPGTTTTGTGDNDCRESHPPSTRDTEKATLENVPTVEATANDIEATAQVETTASNGTVHSVFTREQKHYVAFMVGWGGLFSAISANIYLPALNTLASHLNVSIELINLTITSYMIFQALSPTIFGDFSDMAGRRPAYIIAFIIYLGANIGLAVQDSYAALLALRCLQSAGSSGTIALGAGVIADIVTSAERGSYMGAAFAGALVAPAIGPVIGGLLAQCLGWRAIFWFLVILAAVYLSLFAITFPETGRNVVGNGSIPPQGWNMSLLSYLRLRKVAEEDDKLTMTASRQQRKEEQLALAKARKLRFPNPLATLRIVVQKDVALILTFNALLFVVFYDITATLPTQFKRIYGYNELQIGLCFLPFGTGCALAAWLNGRVLDWNYARIARALNLPLSRLKSGPLPNGVVFPVEHARISVCLPHTCIGLCTFIAYGWTLHSAPASPAPALVLQFILGVTLVSTTNTMSTLLVDLFPKRPATATAANNLARCMMGAAGTAVVELMIQRLGVGWCFTLIAFIVAAATPLLEVVRRQGPAWREERRVREAEHTKRKHSHI